MSGLPLIIAFVIAIIAMILLISKLKVHPFLAIMGISLVLALIAGIPLNDTPILVYRNKDSIPIVFVCKFNLSRSGLRIVILIYFNNK